MKPQEILALRKRLGLTQAQMAERLGVHIATYQQWEYGRRKAPAIAVKFLEILSKESS